jgi:hypothetical protein
VVGLSLERRAAWAGQVCDQVPGSLVGQGARVGGGAHQAPGAVWSLSAEPRVGGPQGFGVPVAERAHYGVPAAGILRAASGQRAAPSAGFAVPRHRRRGLPHGRLRRTAPARCFFEALIVDNPDLGRPENVEIIFGRRVHCDTLAPSAPPSTSQVFSVVESRERGADT